VTTRYQERRVRQGLQLWVERVVPSVLPSHRHGGHRIPDWSAAPRLLRRLPDGQIELQLALLADGELVEVKPTERDRVSGGEDWSSASQLLSAELRAQMNPLERASRVAGARWLEAKTGAGYVRALWSEALSIALEVESGQADDTWAMHVRVELQPLPVVMPWEAVSSFARKELDDFND
jgi:hypothetical protein